MVCNLCYEEIVAPYLIVFIPIENKFSHPRSLPKLSYSVRKEQRPAVCCYISLMVLYRALKQRATVQSVKDACIAPVLLPLR